MNAKIAYYAIPNPTGTSAEAPALPRVIPNGVANTNDVISDITDGIAASEARCRIALEAIIAAALEHVRRGETVDLGGFRLRARIPGSMPCVDTPFDFGENTLVVDVLAEPELNDALADLVPFKVDASELASMVKVSNVTDVATMSIGEIHGTDEFIITGNGVTLDAEGESAKLVDRKSGETLATAEVVTVSKGQRATCELPAVAGGIAPGQYWLIVTTFGLVGETTPRVFRKPVTLTEAVPEPNPHFDSATSEGCREGYVMPNSKVTVTGVGLRVPTADESFFVDMPEGKGRANFTDVSVSADGTALTANVGDWPEGAVPGDGYVVWLDTEGATIAVCEVEVGT